MARVAFLEREARIIMNYFYTEIRAKITHISSYTFDIAILDDDSPFFIEINCFGAKYAAGSALFGWVQDDAMLTGKHPGVVFMR
eukprot:CAMPEP_0170426692 /NCGR_PEP_ID=MMETSP0117_2-20130122/38805_1 /TAXON_ID=400756 /ORGANISM="Durinskia baltica, Strain CSIRO CS-38" /LENGTH=83 /DNA_ID=CAMNT_0010685801 /DNA_START=40 /DNA_END=287 /DNA_ORIENTATION=-